MSDTNSTPQPIVTPGNQTSEFKLTQVVVVVGAILSTLMVMLEALPEPFATNKWVVLIGALVTFGLTVLAKFGYVKARTDLKKAAIASGGTTRTVNIGLPQLLVSALDASNKLGAHIGAEPGEPIPR